MMRSATCAAARTASSILRTLRRCGCARSVSHGEQQQKRVRRVSMHADAQAAQPIWRFARRRPPTTDSSRFAAHL